MWKKEDEQTQRPAAATPTVTTATRPEPSAALARKGGFATIGPSIVIRGEVSGDEDLLIQGQVDGSVSLGLHSVTIGDGGRVKAGITGRIITVEGSVEGDLSAEEQIILRGTARVRGDLNAPRVVLEDGATFRGLVDMGASADADVSRAKPVSDRKEPAKQATAPPPVQRDSTAKADAATAATGKESSAGTPKPATG